MQNHEKKPGDKKLIDITVKDVERAVARYLIAVLIGVGILMLITFLVELLS